MYLFFVGFFFISTAGSHVWIYHCIWIYHCVLIRVWHGVLQYPCSQIIYPPTINRIAILHQRFRDRHWSIMMSILIWSWLFFGFSPGSHRKTNRCGCKKCLIWFWGKLILGHTHRSIWEGGIIKDRSFIFINDCNVMSGKLWGNMIQLCEGHYK